MPPQPNEDAAAPTISADMAARLIMVTPRRVQQLAAAGWIPKAERGRYTVVGVVQGYIKFLQNERQAKENTVRDVRAKEIEQRIAIRDRQLIDIDEHDAVFDEAIGMLKAEFLGIAARVTRDVPLRRKIDAEITSALNRASTRFKQASENLRATGEAARPAETDDA